MAKQITLRMNDDFHKKLTSMAYDQNKSINSLVLEMISKEFSDETRDNILKKLNYLIKLSEQHFANTGYAINYDPVQDEILREFKTKYLNLL